MSNLDDKNSTSDSRKITEEEMIARIYILLNDKDSIRTVILKLVETQKVSEDFVYHCFGRLVLSGAIKQH